MSKSLPYLVSISSYNEFDNAGIQRYYKSLSEANPETYELIIINYAPHFVSSQFLSGNFPKVRIWNLPEGYPGNLVRFAPLFAMAQEMDDDRWIVFTDTYDVVFQKELPDFSVFNRNEVLVADEGECWKDSQWFPTLEAQVPVKFIEAMADKHILNAGTWAMTVSAFKVMFRYMQERAKDYLQHPQSDQPMYNEFIYTRELVKPIVHPTFCSVLYKNLELGNVIKEGNKFYNRNHELYSIVHGNGNTRGNL